ncbi:hypothetical protein [Magnetospira sp. QH-2]|uniref:hypothetical protein n=1 Tax=Magnetospira sp. (strain QH-2) TaxID=1288970 RepID=UPI0003E8197C|nr:hypothetical protein [Magnetospira sp. QH-2]CCQ75743.1 Protein of unknown function [Magnetospira sp. QH-2]
MPRADHCIQLSMLDRQTNQILTLGGTCWPNAPEQATHWMAIPAFPGESMFQAEMFDPYWNQIGEKMISAETVESLLGDTLPRLIDAARMKENAE